MAIAKARFPGRQAPVHRPERVALRRARAAEAIVDTSAPIEILFQEPEADNQLELAIVLEHQAKPDAARQAEAFLRAAAIVIEPVTLQQGTIARQAFYDFRREKHKSRLNFGDCFAYALAKALAEPLLFKGNDFTPRTSEPPALDSQLVS